MQDQIDGTDRKADREKEILDCWGVMNIERALRGRRALGVPLLISAMCICVDVAQVSGLSVSASALHARSGLDKRLASIGSASDFHAEHDCQASASSIHPAPSLSSRFFVSNPPVRASRRAGDLFGLTPERLKNQKQRSFFTLPFVQLL
jgi:hypothetical protein